MSVNGPFRYYIPPSVENADMVFIPYWRIRGLTYTFGVSGVTGRYTDTNLLAVPLNGLPPSLGLRPQAMRLKCATAATPGNFVKPTRTLHDVMPQTDRTTRGTHYDCFIGETASLIYTPMIVKKGSLYDAVLDKPVAPWTPDESTYPAGPIDQETRFTAALCPQCGWDLRGEADALIVTCGNCHTAWSCEKSFWEQIPFAVMDGTADALVYLPFWRLKAQISGLQAASMADFIRLANLPKAVTPAMEEKPLYFWSPAFKINPALFLRWSRQMTIFQPDEGLGSRFPSKRLYPAGLSKNEAAEGIWVTLGSVITDKRTFLKDLPDIRIVDLDALLVYHPFVIGKREVTHERMGVVMERNALKYGATM